MKRMTVAQIQKAVCGVLLYGSGELSVTGAEMDSRVMKQGDCFFALTGEHRDGNDYIRAAFEKGAVCAIVTDRKKAEQAVSGLTERAAILVEDAEQALCDLAAYYLSGFQIKKIAVTGSNGKTTTKDMIHAVLSQKYKTHKTPVNRNNLIGLPLTVLSLEEEHEAAVFEMGMDTLGEIHAMAEIVKPDIAVITNVGVAHIERLGSREGILQAKLEIKDFFGPDNVLIIDGSSDVLTRERAKGEYHLISVGRNGKNDCIISNVENKGEDGMAFALEIGGDLTHFELPVPGEYNVINAALAVTAASFAGVSPKEARSGLLNFQPAEKRMNLRGAHGIKVIDDTYNASPPAMLAALDVLKNTKGVRKVAVLGDMFELGENSDRYHKEVGRYAGKNGVDLLIGIGSLSRFVCEGARESMPEDAVLHFEKKDDFIKSVKMLICSGDVVLIKGSRGMAMETIVKKILE